MALKKQIELDNGVITTYHRIVSINKVTNQNTIIEVASYTSEDKRNEEKEYYNKAKNNEITDNDGINVFIETNYISKEYSENDTIEDCYEYLKTIEKFKDAINI